MDCARLRGAVSSNAIIVKFIVQFDQKLEHRRACDGERRKWRGKEMQAKRIWTRSENLQDEHTRCERIVILTDLQAQNIMYPSIQGDRRLSRSSFLATLYYCHKQVHLSILH